MKLLKILQGLPENKRKTILWSVVGIVSVISFIFYIKTVQKSLKNLKAMNFRRLFQFSAIEKEIKNFQKLEMPEIDLSEELKNEK